MKIVGSDLIDPKTYISVTAVNYGNRATTITNIGFLYYTNWLDANLRHNRADKSFIITTPSQAHILPYRFEAGAQWIGMADQTDEVNQMIREGYLFVLLYYSNFREGYPSPFESQRAFYSCVSKFVLSQTSLHRRIT